MKRQILGAALLALALTACDSEVKVDTNEDTTSTVLPSDTAGVTTTTEVTTPLDTAVVTDTGTTTTTSTTTTTTTTTPTTGAATTPGTTTPPKTTTTPPASTPPASTPPPSTPPTTSTPPPTTPPPTPPTAGTSVDGKAIFTANKCNTCHDISSQGVSKTMASSKAPDLAKVGSRRDAATIKGYLNKTAQINGKSHVKKWGGSESDLTGLANWLAGLK